MQELLENEEKYRVLTEKSPNMIFINQGGRVVYANPKCEEVMGYKRKEFYSPRFNFLSLIHPEDIPDVRRNFLRHRKGKEVAPYEYKMITKGGEMIRGILTSKLIHYRGALAILGIVTDVTEHKKMEEALRKSEKWFRSIFESSHDAMMTLEPPSWRFTSANSAMVWMFRAKDEVKFTSYEPWALSPKRQPDGSVSDEKARKMIETAMRKGAHFFQWTHKRINGEEFSAEVLLTRVEEEEKTFLHATVRDITERKRTEEDLRKSEERFRGITENLPGFVYQFYARKNGQQGLYYVGKRSHEMFGLDPDPAKDYFKRFSACIEKEDRKRFFDSINEAVKSVKRWEYEGRFITPKGEEKYIRGISQPVKLKDEIIFNGLILDVTERKRAEDSLREHRHQLLQIIDTVPHMIFAKDKEGRFLLVNRATADAYQKEPKDLLGVRRRDIHKNRQEVGGFLKGDREVLSSGKPTIISNETFTDVRGCKHILQTIKIPFNMAGVKETCILGVSVDVTEQRKVEEFRNDIVRTVSHELRTPLSIQKEGVNLVLDGTLGPLLPKQEMVLQTVMRSVDRLSRMINGLLDISRIETGKIEIRKEKTVFENLLQDVVFEFRKKLEAKGLEIRLNLPETASEVLADPDKIRQVLTNLVENAFKFTEKGVVEISLGVLKGEVECTVRDTGMGIAPENIEKIFEKFQQFSRTAGPGEKGLGLGLSIAREIIRLHGGRIWARSELGKGTRITFTLPLCGASVLKSAVKSAEPRRSSGGSLFPKKGVS